MNKNTRKWGFSKSPVALCEPKRGTLKGGGKESFNFFLHKKRV